MMEAERSGLVAVRLLSEMEDVEVVLWGAKTSARAAFAHYFRSLLSLSSNFPKVSGINGNEPDSKENSIISEMERRRQICEKG